MYSGLRSTKLSLHYSQSSRRTIATSHRSEEAACHHRSQSACFSSNADCIEQLAAVATCGGCASSSRADIGFICKDANDYGDDDGSANIELSGGGTATAPREDDGSSWWESLPHLLLIALV